MDRAQQIRAWGAGVLLFVAAVSVELAWAHMRAVAALGVICGTPPTAHCAWCPTAMVSGAAGLILLAQWIQQRAQLQPARVRSRGRG